MSFLMGRGARSVPEDGGKEEGMFGGLTSDVVVVLQRWDGEVMGSLGQSAGVGLIV